MSDDLVRRLRKEENSFYGTHPCGLLHEAADRIEQLEAALQHYACGCDEFKCEVKPRYAPLKCGWTARKALEGKND